ncbi:endonuclease/exonuclease/phosphatase family protein [Halomonas sp. Bachu 37]|uniref:endonuclease/exonuclease/phosphatase family protein n=1 Tax=Halomonas kashgarensis TaxID=3084920 RepID=UPI00321703EF
MFGPLLGSIAVLLFLATVIARVPMRWWWIRSFEFPRVQIATLALFPLLLALVLPISTSWRIFTICVALLTVALQLRHILPWTPLWAKDVNDADESEAAPGITLMIANVLTPNRQADTLIDMIKARQPDVILTLESDEWWQSQLDPHLDREWPYSVKIPLDNLYGMHLYSRLPMEDTKVNWLIQDDIPSITTYLVLEDGSRIRFYAVHPRPPAPSESKRSLWRDGELLLVGKTIHKKPYPTLVAGDLNDVAWSRTTRAFCRISGMLDPRRGRGMFSSFHAHYPPLRWPLDHIFVTQEFTLLSMQRLSAFGSDHFPILVSLRYRPSRADEHDTPSADSEERQEARQTIEKAKSTTQPRE